MTSFGRFLVLPKVNGGVSPVWELQVHFVALKVLDLTVHHVDQVSESDIVNGGFLISFLQCDLFPPKAGDVLEM